MKASELRLGNYVSYAETGTQFRVVEIALGGLEVHSDEEMTWIEIEEFEGIPLTEEWLLKFGFKKSRLGYDLDEFSLYHNHSGALPIYGPYWKEWEAGYNIQYVHQLQNIYFAMTGRELIFKEQ